MKILKKPIELLLLGLALLALVLLVLVEIRFTLPSRIESDSWVGIFLIKDATKNILSSISSGIFSAYLFYLFVDYLPKSRTEQKAIDTLNLVLASVLDAYFRNRTFGHETAIDQVDVSRLQLSVLQAEIAEFRRNSSIPILKLKHGMETADSRLPDFRSMIGLAISLSPDHAKQWLVLTDKIRLLAEQSEDFHREFLDSSTNLTNSQHDVQKSLCIRMLEVMEQSEIWLKICHRL